MYIALVIADLDDIPDVTALGGLVFFGGLLVGSAPVGLVVAAIRRGVGH